MILESSTKKKNKNDISENRYNEILAPSQKETFNIERNHQDYNDNNNQEDDIREEVFGVKRDSCKDKIIAFIRYNKTLVCAICALVVVIIVFLILYYRITHK